MYKYGIAVYSNEGALTETVGTNFISTNTFIKSVKCLEEIEGEKNISVIFDKLAEVVSLAIPSLNKETILNCCDVSDCLALVKTIVNKSREFENSKN